MNRLSLVALLTLLAACGPAELEPDAAFDCEQCEVWNESQDPFRVYGNTWYVGTQGLSSLLIETSDGLVLVDGGLPQSAEKIVANVRQLGFDPEAIKTILVSHAHFDHAGGIAAIQRLTKAAVYTSRAGVATLSTGQLQEDDPQYNYGDSSTSFPAIRNVDSVENGEMLTLGDVEIQSVYTPGHTPGGMSWAWESCALDQCLHVVYADSLTSVSAEGFRYSDGAADQLIASAKAITDLDCDILLTPHPFFFAMEEKLTRREDGNPFVNPVACAIYAENSLGWLQQRLESEGTR